MEGRGALGEAVLRRMLDDPHSAQYAAGAAIAPYGPDIDLYLLYREVRRSRCAPLSANKPSAPN